MSEPLAHRWAIRAENDQLRNALNSFIESEYRGTKYNLLHAKYFKQAQDTLETGSAKDQPTLSL